MTNTIFLTLCSHDMCSFRTTDDQNVLDGIICSKLVGNRFMRACSLLKSAKKYLKAINKNLMFSCIFIFFLYIGITKYVWFENLMLAGLVNDL